MRFRTLWPLIALLLVEALAFGLASYAAPPPLTRLSIITALGVLLAGTLPAFVRPSVASMLAGALSIVLAAVVVVPFNPAALDWSSGAVAPAPDLVFRLLNAAALGPLLLHFAAYFPQSRRLAARRTWLVLWQCDRADAGIVAGAGRRAARGCAGIAARL